MTSKRVTLAADPNADIFAALLAGTGIAGAPVAMLTTEHAASSYGLPVVTIDGLPVSPAECRPIVDAEHSSAWAAALDEHVAGADATCIPGVTWDHNAADARLAATPRYDDETLALLDAAHRAGYIVTLR